MRTSNPALNDKVFSGFFDAAGGRTMTVQGTAIKTAILLFVVAATSIVTWQQMHSATPQVALPFVLGGLIVGFILALVIIFKPTFAPIGAPIYAACEGLFLGGVSALYDMRYPGAPLVLQAVILTLGTLFGLLTAYTFRIIKVTENFRLGVFAATSGICLLYLVSFVLRLFGVSIPFIHSSGLIGIGFSLFVVVVAALNLVLDFDFIERGAEKGAPKFMEWYGAFGLLVTLVWLYLEILRLLAKLQNRRR